MKWLMRIIYTLVLFSAWSFLAYLYVDHSLGSPKRSRPVQMEIGSGTSTAEIGHMLKERGLIRNDWFFSTYAWLTGKSKGLQAGVYEIPPDVNVNGILDIITKGRQNTVTVTIPEGYTIEQIGEKLEQKTQFSKEDFVRAAEEEEFSQDFLRKVPTDAQRRYRLEGYLFPSTYNIPKTAKPEDVINMMLGQFHNKMEEHRVMEQLESKNLTLDKWVTIASIVEREGQAKQEFPKIAGVIYNRLNKNMRLQVDATIQYARGAQKARLSYDDLKLDSVYNTYKIDGLPGSHLQPSEKALLAALNPDKHSYLYYVTKKDGTGEHHFAETFEQHRLYIQQSKQTQAQNSSN